MFTITYYVESMDRYGKKVVSEDQLNDAIDSIADADTRIISII